MANRPEYDPTESDFPYIGAPARAALIEAGYTHLAQLTALREAQVLALHGVGPKAVKILRETLAEQGLSFAPPPEKKRKSD